MKQNNVITWSPFLQLCLPGQPCPQETFEGVLGAISAITDANGVVRFNAEYTITLPSPLTNVPNGGAPGVGFGVAQWATPVFGSSARSWPASARSPRISPSPAR